VGNASNFFLGTQGQFNQQPRFNPMQNNSMAQLLQMGQQNQMNPYQGFAPIAQQARSQFNNQTVPSIAERFTSMGSGGALSSPAFASQLGQAGSGLEEAIAALMAQFGQRQQQFGLQQSGQGLQQQNEMSYQPGQMGFMQSLSEQLGPLLRLLAGGIL